MPGCLLQYKSFNFLTTPADGTSKLQPQNHFSNYGEAQEKTAAVGSAVSPPGVGSRLLGDGPLFAPSYAISGSPLSERDFFYE